MTDREFNYGSSGEFETSVGREFNTGREFYSYREDTAGQENRPAEFSAANDAVQTLDERQLTRRRRAKTQAIARVAAAMLTVVLVADSFGIDLLGSRAAEPEAENRISVLSLEEELMLFLGDLYGAMLIRDETRSFELLENAPAGFTEAVWYDGVNAYGGDYALVPGTSAMRFEYQESDNDRREVSAEFCFDGEFAQGSSFVYADYTRSHGTTTVGGGDVLYDHDYWGDMTVTEAGPDLLLYAAEGEFKRINKAEISERENAPGICYFDDFTLKGSFLRSAVDRQDSDNKYALFLEDGIADIHMTATGEDLSSGSEYDFHRSFDVKSGYLKDDGCFTVRQTMKGVTTFIDLPDNASTRGFGAYNPDDPFLHSYYQFAGFWSSDLATVKDEPSAAEPVGSEEQSSNNYTVYELTPEQMNFLAKLYQACKTEDESNVGILLQEVPEGFPEMIVYYDGERAMDRMVAGTPTMKYSWTTYEDKDSSVPFKASDSRVGFYFKGKVEEGSRVVLGYFIDQTDYWLEEPSYHSYESFASFHSIDGINDQDTFTATGFATTIEYEKVNSYNDSTVIVSSSGTYVIDNGEGYLEDGDMMIMWSWPMYDDRGSVSVSVAGGSILDKDKFEIEESSVRYIRVKGSKLDRWTDSETDPFYHSIYQEIYYLTDIFDELYAEWKAER